jgi:hypothetical protein
MFRNDLSITTLTERASASLSHKKSVFAAASVRPAVSYEQTPLNVVRQPAADKLGMFADEAVRGRHRDSNKSRSRPRVTQKGLTSNKWVTFDL